MEANVVNRFLKLALDLMNDQQLKHFEADLNERMDHLKTYLIEHSQSEESAKIVKDEYTTLKTIRGMFVVEMNEIG